jgi:hypothetical protein
MTGTAEDPPPGQLPYRHAPPQHPAGVRPHPPPAHHRPNRDPAATRRTPPPRRDAHPHHPRRRPLNAPQRRPAGLARLHHRVGPPRHTNPVHARTRRTRSDQTPDRCRQPPGMVDPPDNNPRHPHRAPPRRDHRHRAPRHDRSLRPAATGHRRRRRIRTRTAPHPTPLKIPGAERHQNPNRARVGSPLPRKDRGDCLETAPTRAPPRNGQGRGCTSCAIRRRPAGPTPASPDSASASAHAPRTAAPSSRTATNGNAG